MDLNTALQVIKEVCANFSGKLADHQNIQTALSIVQANLKEQPEPKPKKESKADKKTKAKEPKKVPVKAPAA